MLKKITTLFVLCIFFLSTLSVVYAEKQTDDGKRKDSTIKNRDYKAVRAQKADVDSVVKKKMVGERIKNFKEFKKHRAKLLADAKERGKKLKDEAEKIKKHCTDEATADCKKALSKIREQLKKIVARITDAFTKITERIESSDLQNKDELLETLGEHLAELEILSEKITNAETRAELKEVKKELRELWKKHKTTIKRLKNKAYKGRVQGIINHAENVKNKLQKLAERLQSVDVAKDKVAKIEELLGQIDNKIVAIQTAVDLGEKDSVKKAIEELHTYLKRIVHHFNELGRMDDVKKELKIRHKAEKVAVVGVAAEDGVVDGDVGVAGVLDE